MRVFAGGIITEVASMLLSAIFPTIAFPEQGGSPYSASWATSHRLEVVEDLESEFFSNLLFTYISDYPWQLTFNNVSEIFFLPYDRAEVEWLILPFEKETETINEVSVWWEVVGGGICSEQRNSLLCKLNSEEEFRLLCHRKLDMEHGFDIIDHTLIPKLTNEPSGSSEPPPFDTYPPDSECSPPKCNRFSASLIQSRVLPKAKNVTYSRDIPKPGLADLEFNSYILLLDETLMSASKSAAYQFFAENNEELSGMQRHVSVHMYRPRATHWQQLGTSQTSGGDGEDPYKNQKQFAWTATNNLLPPGQKIGRPARTIRNTNILVKWIEEHHANPYPTREEKEYLAYYSGLNMVQIGQWFGNNRRNIKKCGLATWLKNHKPLQTEFPAVVPPPNPSALRASQCTSVVIGKDGRRYYMIPVDSSPHTPTTSLGFSMNPVPPASTQLASPFSPPTVAEAAPGPYHPYLNPYHHAAALPHPSNSDDYSHSQQGGAVPEIEHAEVDTDSNGKPSVQEGELKKKGSSNNPF